MAIDDSGDFWYATSPKDIQSYLVTLITQDGGYVPTEFRLRKCACTSETFELWYDAEQGTAKTKCAGCGVEEYLLDSEDYWEDSEPIKFKCLSKKLSCRIPFRATCNLMLGFATTDVLIEDELMKDELRWVYLGIRCTRCGVLGCVADWKLNEVPSRHWLDTI